MNEERAIAWQKYHQEACKNQELFYTDPDTGLLVQTEFAHQQRGSCCGSGCRHCPFDHVAVPNQEKDSS